MLLEIPLPMSCPGPSGDPFTQHDASWLATLPQVRATLAAAPYDGRATILRCHAFSPRLGLATVACVPARDEAAFLPASLSALATALRACKDAGAVVVVNNSEDRSADIVRDWAMTAGVPVLCCEAHLARPADTVAVARRLALDIAERMAAQDAALLSTDADTCVSPDWAARMTARLREGAAFIAGGIEVDPVEEAALPAAVRHAGAVEAALGAAYQEIWARLVAPTPCPMLVAAGGANMAISAYAYRAVGRLPTTRRNEDRALTEEILAAGLPVAVDPAISVRTSLRAEARARHGMADTIAERCRSADPEVDALLVPLSVFLARICAIATGVGGIARGGETPMRLSEAARALAEARALLARLDAASSDGRPSAVKAPLHG